MSPFNGLIIILSYLLISNVLCQMGMPGMGLPGMNSAKQQRAKPYQKYFSRIQCQVCRQMVKNIIRETKSYYQEHENQPIPESELFNLTERTCHPFQDEGIWITQYDIVKEAPKLKLKLMIQDIKNKNNKDEIGECERECETISYSCNQILDENNIEIVEYLYANLGKLKRSDLSKLVCPIYCKKEKSDIKKKSKMGKEPWYPLFDVEKRQMIQMMDAMPPGVQMYDPSMMNMEDMADMMGAMGDMGDMPEFDDDGNVIEKKKKKKDKKKKSKTKQNDEESMLDPLWDGIDTAKNWFSGFWGDDGGKADL